MPSWTRSAAAVRCIWSATPGHGPTLFLAGACNQVGGEAHVRRMLGHFTQARLAVVPEAGHFMFNDQPEASLALVRAFLAEASR